jgi:fermentation-respiration switch protein FrsA (DUF1100 family)
VLLRALGELAPDERTRIALVTIEGSFHSYQAIARDVLSRQWSTWLFQPLASVLISDTWSPEEFVARVSPIPLLVIHGETDSVVPFPFGEKLFSLAREPKKFWRISDGGHIDLHRQPTRGLWLTEANEASALTQAPCVK